MATEAWDGQDDRDALTAPAEGPVIDQQTFEDATGERLSTVLDLDTWHRGEDLGALYERLEATVRDAVGQEDRIREGVRARIFPALRTRPGAPPGAGVYRSTVADIERVHRGLLFRGAVEACDGTSVMHDTLPVTIAQIGVCLVSYQGDQGSWVHHLFRRDLWLGGADPVEEALQILERRKDRAGLDIATPRDTLSDLGRRAIMAYAERAVLLQRTTARWRMGHGNPLAYELLTGSGMVEVVERSIDLLYALILGHQRFVFVPSAPSARHLLTIGNALQPLEYAIVESAERYLDNVFSGHYRGDWAHLRHKLTDFKREIGPRVVIGLYRASPLAPAQLFYAHRDHVHEAALIALADSTFIEHRGFPALIDLADAVCRGTFDPASFTASTQLAYVEAGEAFRYLAERQTRR